MANYFNTIAATIASGSQESSAICIQGFDRIGIEIPTYAAGLNTAAASTYLKGAETSDGTFREIHRYSAASGYNLLGTPSGAGNNIVVFGPEAGYLPKYIKVCITGTNATATAAGHLAVVHVYI